MSITVIMASLCKLSLGHPIVLVSFQEGDDWSVQYGMLLQATIYTRSMNTMTRYGQLRGRVMATVLSLAV